MSSSSLSSFEKTPKAIAVYIQSLENQFNLFERTQFTNVHAWKLIRTTVQEMLGQGLKIHGQKQPAGKQKWFSVFTAIFFIVRDFLFRNPFLTLGTYHDVVLPHRRQIDGEDIYSKHVLSPDDDNQRRRLILYDDWRGQQYAQAKTMSFVWGIAKIYGILCRLLRRNSDVFSDVSDQIFAQTGVRLHLNKMTRQKAAEFRIKKAFYKLLFRIKKVETVYLVVAYGKEPVIAAAQDLGIETIELQHGLINDFHLGYAFPEQNCIPYFPDKLWLFGQFWADTTPLPKTCAYDVIGSEHMRGVVTAYEHIIQSKTPKSILFCSQGTIAAELFPIARDLATLLPAYTICYRLHPGEDPDAYNIHLKDMPDNIRLSYDSNENTYELMARSEYNAGVYSTTIWEGTVLHCKTIVVALPGHEAAEGLIQKKQAFLANNAAEIAENIHDIPSPADSSYFYA